MTTAWRRLAALALALACTLLSGVAARAAPSGADAPCPAEPETDAQALESARRDARDRGFLWQLSRDGHDSWLYGTLHVGRLAWAVPGPRLADALRSASVVALELDPLDPQTASDFARAVAERSPPGLALDDAQQRRLQRLAERACVTLAALPGEHPMLQLLQLMMIEARREQLDARFGQEIVLSVIARTLKRPLVALETAAQQAEALLPPDAAGVRDGVERSLRQLEEGRVPPLLRRLAQIWEQGDLDALQNYAAWCDCLLDDADRAAFVRLNDARNPQLAARIAELHRAGPGHVFAAVGALHMTGAMALQRLLAERHGFTVQRVVWSR